jgi:hypothetical protein
MTNVPRLFEGILCFGPSGPEDNVFFRNIGKRKKGTEYLAPELLNHQETRCGNLKYREFCSYSKTLYA